MQVPSRKHTKWLKNMDRGDIGRLVAYTDSSQPTITKAIRKGLASKELIVSIDEFFNKKIIEVNK